MKLKTLLLSLLLAAILMGGQSAYAQRKVGVSQTEVSATVSIPELIANSQDEVEAHVDVRNLITNRDILVNVREVGKTAVSGHVLTFCWGVRCLESKPSASPDPITIPAGGTESSFKLAISHYGNPGVTTATYRFYTTDKSDSVDVKFTITFENSVANDKPAAISAISLGRPTPNPASQESYLNYTVPAGGNAVLKIFDFLGKAVFVKPLAPGSGRTELNVRNLKPGIYFCSLEHNGKAVATRKLVVNR